jgi:hypothetical protein
VARFPLRAKLALVALVLLVLPWAGWLYVREMERFLLAAQEEALAATARGGDRAAQAAETARLSRAANRNCGSRRSVNCAPDRRGHRKRDTRATAAPTARSLRS